MFTNRYFLGALTFSFLLHLGLLATVTFVKKPQREVEFEEIHEVTFYDPSQRPEVAGAVGGGGGARRSESGGGGGTGGGGGGGSPRAYMPSIPGYKDLTDDQVAPLNVAATLAGTQAKIDAGRYAADEGEGLDVIHLASKSGGRTASTEEILAAQPLDLSRGVAGSGGGGGSGYAPYMPGGGRSTPTVQPEELAPAPLISQADLQKQIDRSKKLNLPQEQAQPQENVAPARVNKPSVTISGQISTRKRIRSPLPKYPDWATKQGASGTVVIKFYVSADGKVRETVTIETTSGYPRLDDLIVGALKTWQFAPLDPGVPQDDQWGRLTVNFVLG